MVKRIKKFWSRHLTFIGINITESRFDMWSFGGSLSHVKNGMTWTSWRWGCNKNVWHNLHHVLEYLYQHRFERGGRRAMNFGSWPGRWVVIKWNGKGKHLRLVCWVCKKVTTFHWCEWSSNNIISTLINKCRSIKRNSWARNKPMKKSKSHRRNNND